jgi:probable HAF family extracellular repeat protein
MRLKSALTIALFAVLTLPVGLAGQHHHYKLIDLGGGPGGGITGPNTGPLNNLGMLLGGTDTSAPDPFAPNCFADCFVDRSIFWFDGKQTLLPPLPGADKFSSLATSINAEGWSVGQAQNGEVDAATSWPETRAVLWRGNSITDLGSLGGTQGIANGVNDLGQVVGGSATSIPDVFYNDSLCSGQVYPVACGSPFSVDALYYPVTTEVHAFLWHGGHMRDLGTLSGPEGSGTDSTAWMINNLGEVAGWSFTANAPTVEPFFWSPADGKMISMGSLGGTYGTPFWLNNSGQVTGASNLAGDQTEHPFIWSKAKGMHDLFLDRTWCGTFGHPDQIIDTGQVVGHATVAGDPPDGNNTIAHGFLWTNGAMTDLGPPLEGELSYEATSINSKGQIVGGSDYSDVYGFLWENGGPKVNLNDLVVPGSDLKVVQAAFINDRGEIACTGHLPNGDAHPCLLIPCDNNHPGVGGCDYNMVDASATANTGASTPPYVIPNTSNTSIIEPLKRKGGGSGGGGTGGGGRCTPRDGQCPPLPQFPPCCAGLVCTFLGDRAYCEAQL